MCGTRLHRITKFVDNVHVVLAIQALLLVALWDTAASAALQLMQGA